MQTCFIKLMQINCLHTNLMITQFKRKIKRFFSILFIIYSLRNSKFEISQKYLNNNFEKKFIVFFSSFANAFIMFVRKKKRKFTTVLKL